MKNFQKSKHHLFKTMTNKWILLFALIIRESFSATCFDSTSSSLLFPRVLGGTKADTLYADGDISSSGVMALVGYSSSSDLVSYNTKKPFIAAMKTDGTYVFTKRYYADSTTFSF